MEPDELLEMLYDDRNGGAVDDPAEDDEWLDDEED